MEAFTQFINIAFSAGGILLLILGIWLTLGRFVPSLLPSGTRRFVASNMLPLVFAISLAGVIGSLIYSEILGYEPCSLCWLQRIFMYPLPILALVGMRQRDPNAKKYILPIVAIGLLVALYQLIVTYAPGANVPCPAGGASCAIRYVNTFGFSTIPLMSFGLFLAAFGTLFTKEKGSFV